MSMRNVPKYQKLRVSENKYLKMTGTYSKDSEPSINKSYQSNLRYFKPINW